VATDTLNQLIQHSRGIHSKNSVGITSKMHCMQPEPTVDLLLLARLALLQIALPSFLPWPLVSHGLFGLPAAQLCISILTIASYANLVLP